MRKTVSLFALIVVSTLPGCAVTEVKYDQDKIRNALVDLYTNQVIDNLILAANGMPFIQLDYTNATATVTVNQSGSIGGTQQVTTSRPMNLVALTTALARQIQSSWTYGVSGMNTNQIALTANPAIDNDEIYDAYLEYLMEPGSLRISCNPPPEGVAHICRQWRGNYFWVPIEFRTEFLKLALITTAQRGKRLLPAPDFYAVTLTNVVDSDGHDADPPESEMLIVQIDKKLPNDEGHIEIEVNGKTVRYEVTQFATRTENVADSVRPHMTDKIIITFNPNTSKEVKDFQAFKALLPISAKLYLKNTRPGSPPSTENLLQNVRFQLEQIRFNQLR